MHYRRMNFARPGSSLFAVLALLTLSAVHAEQVRCHYTYGGETQRLSVPAVASPYGVEGIQIGSYFQLRVVFQDRPADIASIKIYTYAARDDQVVLIHQASYPYPPAGRRGAPYGFSGLHFLYEPRREGELQYWCELVATGKSAGQAVP